MNVPSGPPMAVPAAAPNAPPANTAAAKPRASTISLWLLQIYH